MGETIPPGHRVFYVAVRLYNARFQPFGDQPDKGTVIDPLFQHGKWPIVGNVVKKASDICFDDMVDILLLYCPA